MTGSTPAASTRPKLLISAAYTIARRSRGQTVQSLYSRGNLSLDFLPRYRFRLNWSSECSGPSIRLASQRVYASIYGCECDGITPAILKELAGKSSNRQVPAVANRQEAKCDAERRSDRRREMQRHSKSLTCHCERRAKERGYCI